MNDGDFRRLVAGAAVDVHVHAVLLVRVEVDGLDDPAVDLRTVGPPELELLGFAHRRPRQPFAVEIGELTQVLAAGGTLLGIDHHHG